MNIPLPYKCRLLLVGHSYIRRLVLITPQCHGVVNFGLPSFLLEAFSLPGAHLSDLVEIVHPILNYSPDIILLDIGGNDMSLGSIDPQASAMAFFFFLRYMAYILRCQKGFYPVILIIEQHYRSRSSRFLLKPQAINHRLAHWHYLLESWAAQHPDICFVHLQHLNRAGWMSELVDGMHLNAASMFAYLCTIHHSVLAAEQILNCEYHYFFLLQMPRQPRAITKPASSQDITPSRPKSVSKRHALPAPSSTHHDATLSSLHQELLAVRVQLSRLSQSTSCESHPGSSEDLLPVSMPSTALPPVTSSSLSVSSPPSTSCSQPSLMDPAAALLDIAEVSAPSEMPTASPGGMSHSITSTPFHLHMTQSALGAPPM